MPKITALVHEQLEKAEQAASFVVADVQAALNLSAGPNPVLAMLLQDVLEQAAELQLRLQRINAVTKP